MENTPGVDAAQYSLANVVEWFKFEGRHADIPFEGKVLMSWTKLAEARRHQKIVASAYSAI